MHQARQHAAHASRAQAGQTQLHAHQLPRQRTIGRLPRPTHSASPSGKLGSAHLRTAAMSDSSSTRGSSSAAAAAAAAALARCCCCCWLGTTPVCWAARRGFQRPVPVTHATQCCRPLDPPTTNAQPVRGSPWLAADSVLSMWLAARSDT